jgi:CPA1 family monovalent cation:H+ antiporter
MLTGRFSLPQAAGAFFITFLGGLATGLVLALARSLIVRAVRSAGMENATFHVLIELLTPFLVFIAAEHLSLNGTQFSGIVAVVTAGLLQNIGVRHATPAAARLSLVSSSVWSMLAFTLNGIVFLLMGTQLPRVARTTWLNSNHLFDLNLIGYVLAITVVMLVIRFIWSLLMTGLRRPEAAGMDALTSKMNLRTNIRRASVMTIAGVRGSVTLATALTIPYYLSDGSDFPHRSLIIFLASGVILVTMLLANFLLPLLAPKENPAAHESDVDIVVSILRQVLIKLSDAMTPENRRATEEVVRAYNARIRYIKTHNQIDDAGRRRLRLQAMDWEKENTIALMHGHKISTALAFNFLFLLNKQRERVEHKHSRRWFFNFFRELNYARKAARAVGRRLETTERKHLRMEHAQLQISNIDFVLEKLSAALEHEKSEHDHSGDADVEDIASLILEYQHRAERLEALSTGGGIRDETRDQARARIRQHSHDTLQHMHEARGQARARIRQPLDSALLKQINDVKAQGLRLEREAIQQMFDEDKLNRRRAKELRDNVSLMELDLEADIR